MKTLVPDRVKRSKLRPFIITHNTGRDVAESGVHRVLGIAETFYCEPKRYDPPTIEVSVDLAGEQCQMKVLNENAAELVSVKE